MSDAISSSSSCPENLRYASTHEWIRLETSGVVVVGITDHAQVALGELVYVELPRSGQCLVRAEPCVLVESAKAASDVYAPLDGVVVEVNGALNNTPQLVNTSPYEAGWLFRMQLDQPSQMEQLLDAEGYLNQLDS